jgi:hypothetical protein
VKTGWSNSRQEWTSLAAFSKEGYGSKSAILPSENCKVTDSFLNCNTTQSYIVTYYGIVMAY